jgi:dihydroorotate dehydrogenase electron transfer subunit
LHKDISKLRIVRVEEIVEECKTMKSIFFKDELLSKAEAGQFAMVWLPNYNEMPMSISYISNSTVAITVKPVGRGTNALFNLRKGELIGVRGPYGNPFSLKSNSLIIGGGIGLAPLMLLAERLRKTGNSTIILAGKGKEELPFIERAKKIKDFEVVFVTEDGSIGFKGLAVEAALSILKNKRFGIIYTCGPEIMMRKMYNLSKELNLEFEASLERYMKCGFGICGSCAIGKYLVCRDGPVFKKFMLSEVENEFGIFTRDSSGKIVRF